MLWWWGQQLQSWLRSSRAQPSAPAPTLPPGHLSAGTAQPGTVAFRGRRAGHLSWSRGFGLGAHAGPASLHAHILVCLHSSSSTAREASFPAQSTVLSPREPLSLSSPIFQPAQVVRLLSLRFPSCEIGRINNHWVECVAKWTSAWLGSWDTGVRISALLLDLDRDLTSSFRRWN